MSLLHLANAEDIEQLLPLVAAFHAEKGLDTDTVDPREAVMPLLDGSPHGAIWLIGPRRAPVGYVAISFGWSLEYGGVRAMVDEIYVRQAVRGRGMGFEALNGIAKALGAGGVQVLYLEVDRDDARALRFYSRARFTPHDDTLFMTRLL
ncbi:MAG: GNAT family N-acetyltransferase [Rhodobacterales bacterium]